jgi:RND family efflux transporter MFP subunit
MSDSQIRELTSTRRIPEVVYINSPIDGFVIARNISAGQTFDRYTEFYRIADLSHVWITADLFPAEEQSIRPGMSALVTLPGWAKPFEARVVNLLPQVDASSRALQVRLETNNNGFVLRPGMVVDVELNVRAPAGLSVPADAVLESGNLRRVFVERSDGSLVPREVQTGESFGDRLQILSGLAPGDKVVTSGTFLVESESRMRTATARKVSITSAADRDQRNPRGSLR